MKASVQPKLDFCVVLLSQFLLFFFVSAAKPRLMPTTTAGKGGAPGQGSAGGKGRGQQNLRERTGHRGQVRLILGAASPCGITPFLCLAL